MSNAIGDLVEENYKLKEEIERLNKQINEALIVCNERQKKIVKLDNIIRELEKYINGSYRQGWLEYNEALEDILDKLQELEGSDKE